MTEQDIAKSVALRAAELARRAPDEWERLLEALQSLTDHRRDECVSSPAEAVYVAQGRAREAASLLRTFQMCLKTADQITEKKKYEKPRTY